MNGTADLFDLPPIARKSDPPTSKAAAARYSATKRVKDRDVVRCLVQQYPGHTVGELSKLHIGLLIARGMDPSDAALKGGRTCSKRLSELEETGEIRAGTARECRATKHSARTWYAVNV
jgi:hypothetical protein